MDIFSQVLVQGFTPGIGIGYIMSLLAKLGMSGRAIRITVSVLALAYIVLQNVSGAPFDLNAFLITVGNAGAIILGNEFQHFISLKFDEIKQRVAKS